MPKGKKRSGLQKDFSTIFEGVWVPPKPHKEQAEPTAQEQRQAGQTPVSDEQDHPQPLNEPDQPVETPISDEQDNTVEIPTPREQASAVETPISGQHEHAADTEISNEQIHEIERIMDSMKCSKGFICYKSGLKNLCKVKKVGEGKIVECSPENQGPCTYRFTFTGRIFCKCSLRHYIAKTLKR